MKAEELLKICYYKIYGNKKERELASIALSQYINPEKKEDKR